MPVVIVEKSGHVLTVTLNRPEKKNCVNCEVMCRLVDAWEELDRDPELRVGILTGPAMFAGPYGLTAEAAWHPLGQPGIISIPLSFLTLVVVSLVTQKKAKA